MGDRGFLRGLRGGYRKIPPHPLKERNLTISK
ncbi:hypothetical protein HP10700_07092 [Helicobacter pylori 10700]|nr:hypothetical protein HPYSS1_07860 [Helicobacter pylori SS1]KAF0998045.1 hypothetical protein HP10700_07092 [Helicobacter pylori 10700]